MQILASACFVVGSVLLVLKEPGNLGAWCYLLGSALFLVHGVADRDRAQRV
jgi:hypothetical protein